MDCEFFLKQPSIFEIICEENLSNSIKAAIKKFIKSIGTWHRSLGTFNRNFEDWFFLFELLLQGFHLRQYEATFTEYFYGLKRVPYYDSDLKRNTKLPWLRSIFLMVILPYALKKLKNLQKNGSPILLQLNQMLMINFADINRYFSCSYSVCKSFYVFLCLFMRFSYILSRSDVHSPLLKITGVRLKKLSTSELAVLNNLTSNDNYGIFDVIWRIFIRLFFYISRLLGFGLFFLEFLEYWRTMGPSITAKTDRFIVPPAPYRIFRERKIVELGPEKCPVCKGKRQNDTVLSVSGYVFCYFCINRYILEHKKCPVTFLPASIEDLIRLRR